jgi:hypothetical protein
MIIGYARCSTDAQDLTAQRDALTGLGVQPDRIYVDRDQPVPVGLREALAACRAGDTLVVTKLDRLARSFLDAPRHRRRTHRGDVKLSIGGSVHDPDDPVGRLLFNVLAMIAEFESDLIRMRTREGMKRTSSSCGALASTPALSSPSYFPSPAQPSTGPSAALADEHQHRPAHEQLNLHQHLPRSFSALTAVPMFLDPVITVPQRHRRGRGRRHSRPSDVAGYP